MTRHGVIMAGGSGERFWPVSTPEHPKQLLDLTGEGRSLLASAVARLSPVVGKDNLWISTSAALAEPIREACLVDATHILAEPMRRNTLGAILWTMASLRSRSAEDFSVAFTTADHAIKPDEGFAKTVHQALHEAESKSALVTIGIKPTRPETGFGYVQRASDGTVKRFTEKPDASTAASFIAAGDYYWNSGMFFWTESAFRRELGDADPESATLYDALVEALAPSDRSAAEATFSSLKSTSIDYALMERAKHVRCVPASFEWDDVGTWDSLLRTVPLDDQGNAVVGKAALLESRDCVVYNTTDTRVSTLGVDGLVVVVTDDQILVTRADLAQDVRKVAQSSQSD